MLSWNGTYAQKVGGTFIFTQTPFLLSHSLGSGFCYLFAQFLVFSIFLMMFLLISLSPHSENAHTYKQQ